VEFRPTGTSPIIALRETPWGTVMVARMMARVGVVLAAALLVTLAEPAIGAVRSGSGVRDTLTGTSGSDVLVGEGGTDDLWRGRGGDVLVGGGSGDQLHGGPGADVFDAGGGADEVHADDGVGDVVACGSGVDTVYADRVDVLSGCVVNGRLALRGGVLATFDVVGERFRAWVTNRVAMWDLLQVLRGNSTANIPGGKVVRNAGRAAHNAPYSWSLDPAEIVLGDFAIEVCDGRPSYVESHVPDFIQVGYCPWSARLLELKNYTGAAIRRPSPPGSEVPGAP
jgi:hypothetical protein